jgi:hypothetical protein
MSTIGPTTCTVCFRFIVISSLYMGARGGVVVEALHYKPEGHGFDSRWRHWILSLT